jgi:hypothetical protein
MKEYLRYIIPFARDVSAGLVATLEAAFSKLDKETMRTYLQMYWILQGKINKI